jgi:hypothetical protein
MPILLDHLIVPSHDKNGGALFLGELLGVPWEESNGTFAPVYVNDTLTIDFGDWEQFEPHHYCFSVTEAEFEAIFGRLKSKGVPYRDRWTCR